MTDSQATKRKGEGGVSDAPAKKHKGAFMITMPFDSDLEAGQTQTSPTHQFGGFDWYLEASYKQPQSIYKQMFVALYCKANDSVELWLAEAEIQLNFYLTPGTPKTFTEVSARFGSWMVVNRHILSLFEKIRNDAKLVMEVNIAVESICKTPARRPILDLRSIPDVILVLKGQKFPINKQVISAQSTYFEALFCKNFKESKQEEIEIQDTDPEDFHELLKMMYGVSTEPTTVDNAIRYLKMADIFFLQIVKDRMEHFLISTKLISIHQKLLIAEEHNLKTLMNQLMHRYKHKHTLLELRNSPEFAEMSTHPLKDLFTFACDLIK